MTEPLAAVVDEIRALVAADGGDVTVVEASAVVLHVGLVLPDEGCRECVMPRPILEQIATDIAIRHGHHHTVRIDDPREPPY